MKAHSDQPQAASHSLMHTIEESLTVDIKRSTLLRIAWLMIAILISFSAYNLTLGNVLLAKIEITLGLTGLALLLWDHQRPMSNWLITSMMVALVFFFYSYLFLSGGVANTGVYWTFLFPFLVFFLHGIHLGLLWALLFFLFNATALLIMNQLGHTLPYSPQLLGRIALVYCAMAGFAFLFESLHYKRQFQMRLDHKQFEALVKNSTDLICVVDPLANMLYLSPSFVSMTGYSLKEAVGKNALQFIHPDDRVRIKQTLKNMALKHKSIERQEYRFKAKNGEWLALEGIGQAIFDEGTITIIINVRNITERKRMEQALQASESKFSTLFHSSHDAIIIHDPDGQIIDCNHTTAQQFAYSEAEIQGLNIRQLCPAQHDNSSNDLLLSKLAQSGTSHIEIEFCKQDGTVFYGDVVSNHIFIDGHLLRQLIIRDITEQHMMAEQLKQAQKMEAIGTLASGIAHNFNNILAGINGNLYLAQRRVQADADVCQKIANIEQLSNRAADLTQQLLTFARKGRVNMQPLQLPPLVREAFQFLRASIPENIDMQLDISPGALQIKADSTQIYQVLLNLVNNSRDALIATENPCITIQLESFYADKHFIEQHQHFLSAHYAHISISDNGAGIPEAQLEHIFEPFFTTKEVDKGTGLGLSMVFGAIKKHHGFIEVSSTPGKGSHFDIYIPLLEAAATDARRQEKQADGIQQGHNELILLVDDDAQVLEMGRAVLTDLGYRVITAANGVEAIDLFMLRRSELSLIITDIVMPKLGGVEAMRRINRIQPDMKVIFSTGYDVTAALNEVTADNKHTIIYKPFSIDQLSQAIRDTLNA